MAGALLGCGGQPLGAPTTFTTKGDAERWLSAAETDMSRGEWYDPRLGDVPFREWADRWMATKAPTLGRRHAGSLPIPAAQACRAPLRRDRRRPHHCERGAGVARRPAPQRIEPEHRREGIPLPQGRDGRRRRRRADRSITVHAEGRGHRATRRDADRDAEQVAELAAAVGLRWEALVFAAAYTGLRWGELAGLRRSDIDLERNLVTVTRKLGEVSGQLSFGPPKTAAGTRTVGLPSFVARALDMHIALYALAGDDGLVFPSAGRTADAAEQLPAASVGAGDGGGRHLRASVP